MDADVRKCLQYICGGLVNPECLPCQRCRLVKLDSSHSLGMTAHQVSVSIQERIETDCAVELFQNLLLDPKVNVSVIVQKSSFLFFPTWILFLLKQNVCWRVCESNSMQIRHSLFLSYFFALSNSQTHSLFLLLFLSLSLSLHIYLSLSLFSPILFLSSFE